MADRAPTQMLAHTLELEQHYKADGATPGAATATGAARTKACCEPRLCVWSSELLVCRRRCPPPPLRRRRADARPWCPLPTQSLLKPVSLSQGLRTPVTVDEESELVQHFLDFVQRGASLADACVPLSASMT